MKEKSENQGIGEQYPDFRFKEKSENQGIGEQYPDFRFIFAL